MHRIETFTFTQHTHTLLLRFSFSRVILKNYNHIYIIYIIYFYNSVFPVLSKFVARLAMKRLNPFSSLTSTTSGLRLSPAG